MPAPGKTLPLGGLRRFGFRLFATYLVISSVTSLLRLLPFIGWTSYVIDLAWRHLVLWTERVVLGMSQLSSIMPTGSGDTGFLWMQGGCQLAAAFAVALVWTSFDRRRRWDPTAFEILRVCVRYVLAAALLGYGFAKLVPPAQFSTPTAGKLLEPIGQLSPMGMLWTFMGASRAYTVFAGIMETAGGLLLLFRRTTPLGALVSAGVLLNVVILNFCYDVPVKLYSANLLLMSVFLLWPDLRRLARVLVLNRPTEAATLTFPWVNRGSRIATIGLKILVIATIFEGQAQFCLYQLSQLDHQAVPAAIEPLLGIWEVDSFRRDGVEIQPLITDRTRWRRVAIESHFGALRLLAFGVDNSALAGWSVSYGSTGDRMLLRTLKNPKGSTMNFSSLGQERLELKGGVQGHLLVIDLHRADKDQSRLLNWGFHWVSEGPWNM